MCANGFVFYAISIIIRSIGFASIAWHKLTYKCCLLILVCMCECVCASIYLQQWIRHVYKRMNYMDDIVFFTTIGGWCFQFWLIVRQIKYNFTAKSWTANALEDWDWVRIQQKQKTNKFYETNTNECNRKSWFDWIYKCELLRSHCWLVIKLFNSFSINLSEYICTATSVSIETTYKNKTIVRSW